MRCSAHALMAAAALAGLAACHRPAFLGGRPKPPTGQVVATVGSEEITTRELQAELGGLNITDPKLMKLAEQRALQRIIVRKLLADAARQRGLNKTPDFALQQERADETILAADLEVNIAKSVPSVTNEEAQAFMSNNPDIFAQRKIFDVDQITFPRPSDPTVLKGIQPLNTLPDVADYLTAQHISFKRGGGSIDAVGMQPRLVDAIVKLPTGTVFIVPSGSNLVANQITGTRIVPLTGPQALEYADRVLKSQHDEEAVQRALTRIVQAGMRTVQYNPAYKPAPPPKQPAADTAAQTPSNAAVNAAAAK